MQNRRLLFAVGLLLAFVGLVFGVQFIRPCGVGFGWRAFLTTPAAWNICIQRNSRSMSPGKIRWANDTKLSGAGNLGTIWIRDATLVAMKQSGDSMDMYLGYSHDGQNKYVRLTAKSILDLSVETEQGSDNKGVLSLQDFSKQVSIGDQISIQLHFARLGSVFSHDAFQAYLSARSEGKDLDVRLKKIEGFGDTPITNEIVENTLSREFAYFDPSQVVMGPVVKERLP